jgi:hypothetical protein
MSEDKAGERASAASHIEPGAILRRMQPLKELLADRPTPSPHVAVICVSVIEGDPCFSHGEARRFVSSLCVF